MSFHEIEFWQWVIVVTVWVPATFILLILALGIIGQFLWFIVIPIIELFADLVEMIIDMGIRK